MIILLQVRTLGFSCSAVVVVALVAGFNPASQGKSQHHEYPTPLIREEQTIAVDGTTETWRLQWASIPTPFCGPSVGGLIGCECTGFAYGEAGQLELVRLRNGNEIERLNLSAFFPTKSAAVQRWPIDLWHNEDFTFSQSKDFSKLVRKRPPVQVMRFGDYDHDGKATEFFLQTEVAPCDKIIGIVIGLSPGNSRLHAFGTSSNPDKPLYLEKREWEALRNSSGSFSMVESRCGEQGSKVQTEIELSQSASGIHGVRREYTCPGSKELRRLTKEEPL